MDKYIGKRLDGRYEINELLGCGGMAKVYSAYDIIDDRTVAIKILKDEFLNNKDFIRRFKNESKAIAVLSHPNIVKIYDVSFGDRIQYIVMENIDGITLKEYIDRQHTIKWRDAVHFTIQILKALQHAHEKGVVHRDVKPQNIMLLKDGTIKVTDFGIARFAKNETRTMTEKAIGSVHYISPEQARGDITDEKSDIYSVGVMLYEMLTGKLPFEADNAVSVAIMQMQSEPKKLREINPEIPEGLEDITLKAMKKSSDHRYKSAEEMLEAIEMFRKNPSIRFEYKYFSDNAPTKYLDAINNIKESKSKSGYSDGYTYNDEEQEPSEKRSKAINILIGAGIALIIFLVVIGLGLASGWFGFGSKDIDVPNFIGMKVSDIVDNDKYKFSWNIEQAYDSSKPEGVIIDQDPKSGTKKIKENSRITLTVNSSGTLVSIPSVRGLTLDAAKAKIKDAGLVYEVLTVEDSDTAEGIVKGTDPKEGTEIVVNSMVRILVSKGPAEKKVTVPDVINKPLSGATKELIEKGLKVSDNIIKETSNKAKDTVLSTNPLPGVEVNEGSAITLTISSGESQEKTLKINVDLPSSVNHEVSMKVYINGVMDSSNSKTIIPAYNSNYSFSVKGSGETKTIIVNLDGQKYRVYEVNFSSETVRATEKYNFNESSESTTSSKSSNKNHSITETRMKIRRRQN